MRLLETIAKAGIEFHLLPFQFSLLSVWGIWLPENASTKVQKLHKGLFNAVYFLDIILSSEMLIFIGQSITTHSFQLVNVFLTTAAITGIYKAILISSNREAIRSFVKHYFERQFFKSDNSQEEELIIKSNDLQVRKVIIAYSLSMGAIFAIRAISPMLTTKLDTSMPVDAWYPYDIQKWYCYWLTYAHQVILGSSLISVHLAVDTLFVGLLLKLSCQIDMLKYRIQKIPQTCCYKASYPQKHAQSIDKMTTFHCIKQHQIIYRFAKDLSGLFQQVLLIQVITSIPNLCMNIYVLSTQLQAFDIDVLSNIACTSAAFTQLFLSCWYGNEVTENSLDLKNAIFQTDWTKLDVSVQKLFIMQMLRCSKPIEFSVGYVIPLNIESFIKIVKTSYSAFNLLQQT